MKEKKTESLDNMLKKKLSYILLLIFSILLNNCATPKHTGIFYFPKDKKGNVDWPHSVKVKKQDTPVYYTALVSSKKNEALNFNENLMIEDVHGNYIKVRQINSEKPLGWVNRSDILSVYTPRKSKTGLEQLFYVKADIGNKGQNTVKAYPSSDLKDYYNKGKKLSNFSAYFIFDIDESNNSVLLSDYYRLDETARLIGWVSKNNGFIWDTAYGLRPASAETVCAYLNIQDAISRKSCVPITGGNQWFKSKHRIPLADAARYNGFYKVLLPFSENRDIQISPEMFHESSTIIQGYIPVSDNIAEDVWLKSEHLGTWELLLKNMAEPSGNNTAELRKSLVFIINDVLKSGLPVNNTSHLIRYSTDRLNDPEKTPDCEIIRLAKWLRNSRELLGIVSHGNTRPVYKKPRHWPGNCQSGNDIPYITDIRGIPFSKRSGMRYDHSLHKVHVYWVPKEYLP